MCEGDSHEWFKDFYEVPLKERMFNLAKKHYHFIKTFKIINSLKDYTHHTLVFWVFYHVHDQHTSHNHFICSHMSNSLKYPTTSFNSLIGTRPVVSLSEYLSVHVRFHTKAVSH